MKHSQKRNKILNLFTDGSLLTANEVCKKLPEIDRATVYRNLDLFTQKGILRKVNVKEGISSYEIVYEGDNHQHFICKDCEKIIPVDVSEELIKKIIPQGINVEDFELNLKGKCEDCNIRRQ